MRRLACLLLLLSALPAQAFTETDLRLDRGIAATLTLPEGDGPFPAVLMLHGLGSSRAEVGNLFVDQAEALAEAGIAALRIDFRGFGQSPGDTGAFTLERQNQDAALGLAALRSTPGVDPARLGVIGFSFGGAAAIELAATRPEGLRALVALTPVGDYRADMLDSMGQKVFDRAAEDGIAGIDFGWRTLALRHGFFDGLARHDLLAALARWPGPLLIVHGESDPYRRYTEAMLRAAAGTDKRALVIPGANHVFDIYTPSRSHAPEVIAAVVDWLKARL